MRYVFAIAALLVTGLPPAAGQQNTTGAQSTGVGIIAPSILAETSTVSKPKHCDELDGVVKFSATVDTAGIPHQLKALDATERRLIAFATEVAEAQRFKPARLNNLPATVAIKLTVGLRTCAQREKNPADDTFYRFTLCAPPVFAVSGVDSVAPQETLPAANNEPIVTEKMGEQVSAPIPTVLSDPQIPVSKKFSKRGRNFLGFTIDANGVPQNVHIVRGLDPESDSNLMEAVKISHFKPALRDGSTPVAVEATIVGTFEYIEKEPVAYATFIPDTPEHVLATNDRDSKRPHKLEPTNADEVIARYFPKSRVTGLCVVSVVIDTQGVPQNVHVIKGLDSSLDMDTVAMVEHFRFNPVILDGTNPVPVGLIVPVRFRATAERLTWNDFFYDLAVIPMLILK